MLIIKGFDEKKVLCKVCGREIKGDHIMIPKFGFVCSKCYSDDVGNSHCAENTKFIYKPRKDTRTVSFEFETGEINPEIAILYKYNFIPTPDGSIDGLEWKSPIYRNLTGVVNVLKLLDKFADMVDDECGTHIHVGTIDRSDKRIMKMYDRKFFEETFKIYDTENLEPLFGRDCNNYCASRFTEDRYQAINYLTDKPTVEFRTPKFINSKQFMLCIKYGIDYVNILTKNINKNREDYEWGGKCGRTKAEKLGNMLAELTNKYLKSAKQI